MEAFKLPSNEHYLLKKNANHIYETSVAKFF